MYPLVNHVALIYYLEITMSKKTAKASDALDPKQMTEYTYYVYIRKMVSFQN